LRTFATIRNDAGLFCESFLRNGEVLACVGQKNKTDRTCNWYLNPQAIFVFDQILGVMRLVTGFFLATLAVGFGTQTLRDQASGFGGN